MGSSSSKPADKAVVLLSPVAELRGHTSYVYSVAFDPSGKYILAV